MLKGGVKANKKEKSRNPIYGLNKNVSLANIPLVVTPTQLSPIKEEKSSQGSLMDELTALFEKVKIPKSRVSKAKGVVLPSRRSTRIASIPQVMTIEREHIAQPASTVKKVKTEKKTKSVTTRPAELKTKGKSKRELTDSKTITTKKIVSKIKSVPYAFKYSVDKQKDKLNKYFDIIDKKLRDLQSKSLVRGLTPEDREDLMILRKYDTTLKSYLLRQLEAGNIEKGIAGSYYQTLLDLEASTPVGMQEGGKQKNKKKN